MLNGSTERHALPRYPSEEIQLSLTFVRKSNLQPSRLQSNALPLSSTILTNLQKSKQKTFQKATR